MLFKVHTFVSPVIIADTCFRERRDAPSWQCIVQHKVPRFIFVWFVLVSQYFFAAINSLYLQAKKKGIITGTPKWISFPLLGL
jgi:hypothetical protein